MKLTEIIQRGHSPAINMQDVVDALKQLLPSDVGAITDAGQAVTFKFKGHTVDVVYRGRKWDLVIGGKYVDTFDRKDIDGLSGLERLVISLKDKFKK